MMKQDEKYRIFWQKIGEKEARIVRIYGISPVVRVPEKLCDRTVTQLSDYCLAQDSRLSEGTCLVLESGEIMADEVREIGGTYLEEAYLPDTLTDIGNYCFYNCRNLARLEIGSRLVEIGSDAFMNCHKLHSLVLRCSVTEKSGLHRILGRIPWDLEASFYSKQNQTEAVFFYPEYTENYDEIAPAHLFGRSISGEGFRARQCFRDGIIDFERYDAVFLQACVEETAVTMCRFALDRLRFPVGLREQSKIQYEDYIRKYVRSFLQELIQKRALDLLSFLYEGSFLEGKDETEGILLASAAGWTEGSVCLQRIRQARMKTAEKDRYAFDDF